MTSNTKIIQIFVLGIKIFSTTANLHFLTQDVNLEQQISKNQIPTSCEVVIFNDQHHGISFIPFYRPTVIHQNLNHHHTGNERRQPEFKLKLNAECQVLVIFGFQLLNRSSHEQRTSYDEFLENSFNTIMLILIFPLEENFESFRKQQDTLKRRSVWTHNLRVIDHCTNKIIFSTVTTFRFCKSADDPVCVLKGIAKRVGYTSTPPYLYIQSWGKYIDAGLQYPPIELHPQSPASILSLVSGLEGELLKHFVLEYNMNLTLVSPNDMTFGFESLNNTWTGKFGLLERKEVDFIVGLISGNWDRRFLGEYLSPLYNSKYSLISRKYPANVSWDAPFTVLSLHVLVVMFGCCILVFLLFAIFAKIHEYLTDIHEEQLRTTKLVKSREYFPLAFKLVASALKQPVQKIPKGPSSMIFASWFICLFIILSIYSSYLTARLSIPNPESNIDNMRDVRESKRILLTGFGGTVDLYTRMSRNPDTQYVIDNYHQYTRTIQNYSAVKAADNYQYVLATEEEWFRFQINAGKDGTKRKLQDYHFSKEPLVNVFCSWIASKKLREAPAMTVVMLRALDMGLLTKWSTDRLNVDGKKSISTRKLSSSKSEDIHMDVNNRRTTLTMNVLKGVFLAWMCGISVSLVVFFAEIFVANLLRLKPKPRPRNVVVVQYIK